MRSIWFSAPLSAFLVMLLLASVSAQGYPPDTITAPVVAPITITDHLISGELHLTYPDGTTVWVEPQNDQIYFAIDDLLVHLYLFPVQVSIIEVVVVW